MTRSCLGRPMSVLTPKRGAPTAPERYHLPVAGEVNLLTEEAVSAALSLGGRVVAVRVTHPGEPEETTPRRRIDAVVCRPRFRLDGPCARTPGHNA